jgi:hypothetical protein
MAASRMSRYAHSTLAPAPGSSRCFTASAARKSSSPSIGNRNATTDIPSRRAIMAAVASSACLDSAYGSATCNGMASSTGT